MVSGERVGPSVRTEVCLKGSVGRDVHEDETIPTHLRWIRAFDVGELKLETASGIVIGSGRPFFVPMESAGLVDAVDRGGMIAERKFDGRTNNAQGAGGIRRYNEV